MWRQHAADKPPKRRSLIARLGIIYLIWAGITFAIMVCGLWWASSYIVQQHLIKETVELIPDFQEMGASLYQTHSSAPPAHVARHAQSHDVGMVRYLATDGARVLGEYREQGQQVPLPTARQLAAALSNTDYVLVTDTFVGLTDIIRVIAPIHGSGKDAGRLVGYLDLTMDMQPSKALLNKMMALLTVLLGYAILFMLAPLGARTLQLAVKPLHELQGPLQKLAEGDFNLNMDIEAKDAEIAAVIDALRAAMAGLHQRDVQKEQALRDKLKAELANEEKGMFLAHMSHEIRTPLNGVLGFLNLLSRTELSNTQRDYLRTTETSARTLLAVINDVLDFSKIESGHLAIEHIPFDLREIVEDCAALHAMNAHEKGLELVVEINHQVPASLRGDPTRITQVLSNLIGNAIKFTQAGEIRVRVNSSGESNGQGRVHIDFEVADSGIGMTPDVLENLFKPYVQAHASTSRQFGGTGLGLAICKRLVEMMGGNIQVQSTPVAGSTFHFGLPLEVVDMAGVQATGEDFGKLRVLCATPSQHQAVALYESFLSCGVKAEIASSAATALQLLGQAEATHRPVDLLVADHALRDIPSRDFSLAIKQVHPERTPYLVLMMRTNERILDACERDECFDEYLTKPVKRKQLHGALMHLRHPSLRQAAVSANGESASRQATTAPMRVLVADDNEINRKLAVLLLKQFGASVEQAENGAVAVEACACAQYDLILMDVNMPVMDGLEATRQIRVQQKGAKRVPIVALTANAMSGDKERFLAAGMDGYLSKPIVIQELQKTIAEHCQIDVGMAGSGALMDHGGAACDRGDGLALVDHQKGIAAAFGDEETWRTILRMHLDELPSMQNQLESAWQSSDVEALRQHAHRLNGSAASSGTPQLQEAARRLENACGQGAEMEAIGQLYRSLRQAILRLREHAGET